MNNLLSKRLQTSTQSKSYNNRGLDCFGKGIHKSGCGGVTSDVYCDTWRLLINFVAKIIMFTADNLFYFSAYVKDTIKKGLIYTLIIIFTHLYRIGPSLIIR